MKKVVFTISISLLAIITGVNFLPKNTSETLHIESPLVKVDDKPVVLGSPIPSLKKEKTVKPSARKFEVSSEELDVKLQEIDQIIEDERYVEFANQGTLSEADTLKFKTLLQLRNQIFKQKVELILKGDTNYEKVNI